MTIRKATALFALLSLLLPTAAMSEGLGEKDPAARDATYEDEVFKPDPDYGDRPYDAAAQEAIYGGKHLNKNQRPLVEAFRDLYNWGGYRDPINIFGDANPFAPQFMVFGDFRTALAINKNGDDKRALWANRLNLDVDLKLTATERIHAFWDPIRDPKNKPTRYEFAWEDGSGDFDWEWNWDPKTIFFEGDLASMAAGLLGTDRKFDMPIAGGRMPLLFANGIWVEDTFDGFAMTIPARNSRLLDISNMDFTVFFGFDNVTNQGINAAAKNHDARMYGVTGFIEALNGYFEIGYGWIEDRTGNSLDHHNVAFSYTRRYRNWISNSVRVIGNFGQNPNVGPKTADGVMFLIENSLITHLPSNLIPYLNVFYGSGNPNPLARENGDGFLKNTGILFETDALSGFPRLNNSGHDAWGGALGLEWLALDFSYQVVFELATVQRHGSDAQIPDSEYGVGIRFQYPLTNALILRMDAMYAHREEQRNLAGARAELRYKF